MPNSGGNTTVPLNRPLVSKQSKWAGLVTGGVPALLLLLDGGMKLVKPQFVVEATTKLGYPESVIVGIGATLVTSTLLYLVPRTAFLGAVLLTGYLGGAVATQVRIQSTIFNIAFPAILGALLWGGLWLRDNRLRELLPLRAS
jgi:hypothetical protein